MIAETIRQHDGTRQFDPVELIGLPDAVRRYFMFALTPGQALVRKATIEHAGWFTMKPGDTPAPFTSVEQFWTMPPEFKWVARMQIARMIAMRVCDSYRRGTAGIDARIAGIPVMRRSGTPELASGALLRWLAEAAWVPTALLPSNGVTWERRADAVARASFSDGPVTVSMDARFGPGGEICRVSAERFRDVKGKGVLTHWTGYFANYERREGMMIPMTGWVEWALPEGRFVYWRGRVTDYRANFVAAGATPGWGDAS